MSCCCHPQDSFTTTSCCCFFCVPQSSVAIVTNCGKYEGLAAPGLHYKDPCGFVSVPATVSLRIQSMDITVQTKTRENVFVTLAIEVKYQVLPGAVDVSFYYLQDPTTSIRSYVSAAIRASVPRFDLDSLYLERNHIAADIKTFVDEKMDEFGYDILNVLIEDIRPDAGVRLIMDKLLASRRLQVAAQDVAEAESILRVKGAEARAELTRLRAVGVASQRREVLKGLEFCVEAMRDALPHYSSDELLHTLLTNQYLDTLKEIATFNAAMGAVVGRSDTFDESDGNGLASPTTATNVKRHPNNQTATPQSPAAISAHNANEKRLAELKNQLKVAEAFANRFRNTDPSENSAEMKLKNLSEQHVQALKGQVAEAEQLINLEHTLAGPPMAFASASSIRSGAKREKRGGGGGGGEGGGGTSLGAGYSHRTFLSETINKGFDSTIYMPHVGALHQLAEQLVVGARRGVPTDRPTRDQQALLMMQGKRPQAGMQ